MGHGTSGQSFALITGRRAFSSARQIRNLNPRTAGLTPSILTGPEGAGRSGLAGRKYWRGGAFLRSTQDQHAVPLRVKG